MKKFTIMSLIVVLSLVLGVGLVFASGAAPWGYTGDTGPDHWAELSPDYAACSAGREQSPIDVPASAPVHSADIEFDYEPTALDILNNGHTIEVEYEAGSSITVEGKTFNLIQFHYHSLSEHTLHGGYFDMEMHLVHKSADGEVAVVGILLERGAENAAYAPVWDNLPAAWSEPEEIDGVHVNAQDLLPATRTYYRYNGSFTTPPCTEGVRWFMMSNSVELSDAQIDAFRAIFDNTYRPVQPFYERTFNPAVEAVTPVLLPESGSVPFPVEGVLLSFGALSAAAGLWLRRRKLRKTTL